jgi:hypothetical protein
MTDMPSRRNILTALAIAPGTSFAFERDGARNAPTHRDAAAVANGQP